MVRAAHVGEARGMPCLLSVSRLVPAALVAVTALLAVGPASASAVDHQVAAADGSDAGTCVLLACKTVGYAVSQATAGDRVVVYPGTYSEQVTLGASETLIASGSPRATIDGGAGTAVTVVGANARVEGLRLRGDAYGATANNAATGTAFVANTFDDTALNLNGKLSIFTGTANVSDNVFTVNASTAGSTRGLYAQTTKLLDITRNTFDGFFEAIRLSAFDGGPRFVHENEISQVHGSNGSLGSGVVVRGSATVTANVIGGAPAPSGFTYGISAYDHQSPPNSIAASLVTRRNRVFGVSNGGIYTSFGVDSSSLVASGDVVTGNGQGFQLYGRHLQVTGATVFDNKQYEIYLGTASAQLSLDSSVIGPAGVSANGDGCTISFTRGPTTSGGACERFTTSVNPGFAGPGDYRLAANSPLIDAGNPAPPAAGEQDADGHARAVVGSPGSACAGPRRDVGAYELVPSPGFTCAAPTPATAPGDVVPAVAPPPPPLVTVPPALGLSAVALSRPTLTKRHPATLSFTLTAKADVSLAVWRASAGRRRGTTCVRATRGNRRAKRCTRYVRAATIELAGHAGSNTAAVATRIARRTLTPGRYRLTLTATPASGGARTRTLVFRVKR